MALASDIHLRQTKRFINENPSKATIHRRLRVSDGQGGMITTSVNDGSTLVLDTGDVRLVQRNNLSDRSSRTTSDGRVVVPTYVIIAMPEEIFEPMDVVALGGSRYEVIFVSRNPEWRLSAEVVEFRG